MSFVSVVVLARNEESVIGRCLQSLMNQSYSNFEVIVVDGGSTDRTREIVSTFGVKVLIEPPPQSYGHARNLGVAFTKPSCDVVAFLTGHGWVNVNWLTNLMRNFDTPSVGVVLGRTLPANPVGTIAKLRAARTVIHHKKLRNSGIRVVGSWYATTDNAAFRRRLITMAWGFNNGMVASEDKDLALKIERLGFKIVYESEAIAHHVVHDRNLNEVVKRLFREGVGLGQCIARYHVWRKTFFGCLAFLGLLTLLLALLWLSPILTVALLLVFALLGSLRPALENYRVTQDWTVFGATYVYYPLATVATATGVVTGLAYESGKTIRKLFSHITRM